MAKEIDELLREIKAINDLPSDSLTGQSFAGRFTEACDCLQAHQPSSDVHWLHENLEDAATLLVAAQCMHKNLLASQMVTTITANLQDCPQCVVTYHSAKDTMAEMFGAVLSDPALQSLQSRDEARITAAIQRAHANPKAEIGSEAVTALFEALSYEALLDDQEVVSEMEKAFMRLSAHHDLALTEGGRYPGVYKLLAHENSGLRSLISPIVRSLGRFEDEADVAGLLNVIHVWLDTLSEDRKSLLPKNGRPRHEWHVQPTWQALNVILGLMDDSALCYLLRSFPDMLPLITSFALQGSPISWSGLACLSSIYQNAGPQAIRILSPDLAFVEQLANVALSTIDGRLQIFVVQALNSLVQAMDKPNAPSLLHNNEELCSRTLYLFLEVFQLSYTMKAGSKELAERDGLKYCMTYLERGSTGLFAHIFGPHICRQLMASNPSESSNHQLIMKLVHKCLDLDVDRLQRSNSAGPSDKEDFLAPCLWQGLAETENTQVVVKLLSCAGLLAHTPAGEPKRTQHRSQHFGHFREAERSGRIGTSIFWPQLQINEAHHPNPHAIRAAEAPALLLQAFRQVVSAALEKRPFSSSLGKTMTQPERSQLVEALFKTLVGVHMPLRKAAEASLLEITDRSTITDALGTLFWTNHSSDSIFGALSASLADFRQQALTKAMVGSDMLAFLTTAIQVLQAAEDTGKKELQGRREFVHACWQFATTVLVECKQIAKLTVASSSLQRLFTLLPTLWELKIEGSLGSSTSKPVWRRQLGFMTDLISWSSVIGTPALPFWQTAVERVLRLLPGKADSYLPEESLQAGRIALSPSSTAPDSAKLFLAPIIGKDAPGNLGKSALDFSWKSGPLLPPVPTKKAVNTIGRNFGQKEKAESVSRPNLETEIDLTGTDDEALEERIGTGRKASAANPPRSAGQRDDFSKVQEFGYESDTPIEQLLETQKALWAAATKQTQHRKEPWREKPQSAKAPPSSQKTLATFVTISPHKKGDEKTAIPPVTKDRLGGVALESIWKSAKQAKADVDNREALKAVQNVTKQKSKSKLKALIEKEETAIKEANRRLPRSERNGVPHQGKKGRLSPEVADRAPFARSSVQPALPKAPASRLQVDDHLEAQLASAKTKVVLPTVERRSLLPAAPKPVRKAIQLSQDPGMQGQTVKRRATVTRPQSYEKVLSLEKVQQDILSWDLDKVTGRFCSDRLEKLPDTFDNLEHYTHTFWRLMHEELRAHIQQACEEGLDAGKRKSKVPRSNAETISVPLVVREVQRRSTLHRVDFVFSAGDRESCRTDDFVLLTRTPVKASSNMLNTDSLHIFGLVIKVDNHDEVRGQRVATINVNLLTRSATGSNARLEAAQKSLLQGTTWHCTTILSWIPHQRQFQALCNAHTLSADLVHQLVAPTPPQTQVKTNLAGRLPVALTEVLMGSFNESQYSAIRSACLSDSQFTLIQGPPGTGKTSTVIGIISALLAAKQSQPQTRTVPSVSTLASRSSRIPPGKPAGSAPDGPSFRVLVCAQSNAAIDELIMRLADPGLIDSLGSRRVPAMVRLGKMESTHESIKTYHIDAVSAKAGGTDASLVNSEGATSAAEQEVLKLREKLNEAKKALDTAEAKQKEEDDTGSGANLGTLRDTRRRLALQLKSAKDKVQQGSEQRAKARKEVRQAVVQNAEIVTCTLSSAGGDLLTLSKGSVGFQALIIDEAAQAVEPSALIAFQLLAPGGKVVMVGDPQQLPPTVLSKAADSARLSQSLFQRLQEAKWPVTMLSEQFRMHPKISSFPAAYFYSKKLVDAAPVKGQSWTADFHSHPCFPPFAVYNCSDGRESSARGGSISNALEAELAVTLLTGLLRRFPSTLKSSIAILTPYKSQVAELRYAMSAALSKSQMQNVEAATVDGFQGKEADVVFFSCVRARAVGQSSSIGFLADVRRMNVALSRARRGLYVIGHAATLKKSPPWAALLQHARRMNCLFSVEEPFNSILSSSLADLVGDAGEHARKPSPPPLQVADDRTARKTMGSVVEAQRKRKQSVQKELSTRKKQKKVAENASGGLPAPQLYPPGFEDVPPPPPPLPQPGPALGKGAGGVADKHIGKDHVMFRDLPPPLPADSPPPLPESLPFSQPPLPTDTPPD